MTEKSGKKRGAPEQPEIGRKLAVLGLLIKQADRAIPVIDLCRAVAQMDPEFFDAELPDATEIDVLQAIARGRNTLTEATWMRVDAAATKEAERNHPADARGTRSRRAQARFEARLRAERARLLTEHRQREAGRQQVFDAAAAALKTAYYALSDAERVALVSEPYGADAACDAWDRLDCKEQWTLG